jgi:hypothetical protein
VQALDTRVFECHNNKSLWAMNLSWLLTVPHPFLYQVSDSLYGSRYLQLNWSFALADEVVKDRREMPRTILSTNTVFQDSETRRKVV